MRTPYSFEVKPASDDKLIPIRNRYKDLKNWAVASWSGQDDDALVAFLRYDGDPLVGM